jgi:hypothetical protein
MARRQRRGAERLGPGKEIGELDRLIAAHARHRGLAGQIAVGEIVDDGLAELRFEIEDVMRNVEPGGDPAGIVDIAPGAAGPGLAGRGAVIIELQGDADDVVARMLEQAGDHRRIHAARHGHDDARRRGVSRQVHVTADLVHDFVVDQRHSSRHPSHFCARVIHMGRPGKARNRTCCPDLAQPGARRFGFVCNCLWVF